MRMVGRDSKSQTMSGRNHTKTSLRFTEANSIEIQTGTNFQAKAAMRSDLSTTTIAISISRVELCTQSDLVTRFMTALMI